MYEKVDSISFGSGLCAWLGVGCNNKTVNIDLPFEVGDVENIEMYHFVGALCQQKRRSLLLKKP